MPRGSRSSLRHAALVHRQGDVAFALGGSVMYTTPRSQVPRVSVLHYARLRYHVSEL